MFLNACFFFFQAEDGIRDADVTGVQTCALPIWMILHPITLGPDRPLREAVRLMERFRISGVPIVDDAGRLVGIITNRDLQFERELDRPIRAAMTKERLVTTPVCTTLHEAERILRQQRIA